MLGIGLKPEDFLLLGLETTIVTEYEGMKIRIKLIEDEDRSSHYNKINISLAEEI